MILIRQATLYTPDAEGIKDVLVAGGQVVAVQDKIEIGKSLQVQEINGEGKLLVPGFLDAHVHIAGAGGEGGPQTRTPELPAWRLAEGGVTGVVGCLGTDGFTRNQESVLMQVKALKKRGFSAWMYAGAYQVPTPTLLGDLGRDVALIEEVIGAGEIALSDHRSSTPTVDELVRLAEHVRVGGMLGGKAGIVNIHLGDAQKPFAPLLAAAEKSELPLKQFFPTHINRNAHIFEEAKAYGKKSWVDITTSAYPFFPDIEVKPSLAVKKLLESDVPPEHITLTSDANGSLPDFDAQGNLLKLEIGWPKTILNEVRDMVLRENLPIPTALQTVTRNVAHILKLPQKGAIRTGAAADLLLLGPDFQLEYVISNGQLMMEEGKILIK